MHYILMSLVEELAETDIKDSIIQPSYKEAKEIANAIRGDQFSQWKNGVRRGPLG